CFRYSRSSPTPNSPPATPLPLPPASPTVPTTYATSRFAPPSAPLTITTAAPTLPCPRNTVSTSPNSIRYPRTFTCSSLLPTYSTRPSAHLRPTSPVRYNRPPNSPCAPLIPSGTNRCAVSAPSPT